MDTIREKLSRAVQEVKSIAADLWNSAAESGFCCGIRLATCRKEELMPTPSSCCGVRV
jgi:hypothetical protein